MKLRRPWAALVTVGVLTSGLAIVLTSSGASAAGGSVSPVITSDANAQGTISFFNKAGDRVYGGPLAGGHIADYAVASSATSRTGTTKAGLVFATPDHTQADSQTYAAGGATAASVWNPAIVPPAALGGPVPASVTAAAGPGVPVVAMSPTDGDVGGAWSSTVDDPTAGFDHIVQVRLLDAGPGHPAQVVPFWQADVYIDTVAGTWTQLFPVPPAAATGTSISALTASPASPAPSGTTSVALSATLSAADNTHPAGSVHLFGGTADLGPATFNAATGAITASGTVASGGSYSFSFKFTPSSASYNPSASAGLAYTVTAAATATSISALAASPTSPAPAGTTSVALSATVSAGDNTHPAGSVHLFNGPADLGTATLNAATGAITANATVTPGGSYTYSFKFTPTSASYNSSTSATLAYAVTAAASGTSVTTPTANPASPAAAGTTSVALSATVSASDNTHPAGSVHLFEGITDLGAATLNAATGAVTGSATVFNGGHFSFSFAFTPTSASYSSSTSAVLAYTVSTPPASIDTSFAPITANPASPAPIGTTSVSLTSTLSADGASHPSGTVELFNGGADLGPATLNASTGAVSATATVAGGSYNFIFKYTPTGIYNPSQSASLAYTVDALAATTTVVNGPGTDPVGIPIALHADVKTGSPAAAVPAPAGSVQFSVNGASSGAPVGLTATGADFTYTPSAVGPVTVTAAFVPAAGKNYSASSDTTGVTVQVTAASTVTTSISAIIADPASPAPASTTSVNLAATLSASGNTLPAGSVELFDGTNGVAAAALDGATGAITATATVAAATTHSFTFVFTPTGTASGSTSAVLAYSVQAAAVTTPTQLGLSVNPAGPITVGTPVVISATVDPSAAVGTVVFSDDGTALGAPATVVGGVASITLAQLDGGEHSFTAAFTPTDETAFGSSAAGPVTLAVNSSGCTCTQTTLATSPAGTARSNTPVSLTATVSPSDATGTVEFFDDTTSLGTAEVAGGVAQKTVSFSSEGSHPLTAVFTPSAGGYYLPSTSAVAAITINRIPQIDSITLNAQAVTQQATLAAGATLSITGSDFVPGDPVAVVISASSPVTVATTTANPDGTVTATFALPDTLDAGQHTITLLDGPDAPVFSFVVAAVAASSTPATTPTVSVSPALTGSTPTTPSSSLSPAVTSVGSTTPKAPTTPATTGAADSSTPTTVINAADPVSPQSGGGASLASTGAKVTTAATLGLLLIAGGLVLITGGRRRRRSH